MKNKIILLVVLVIVLSTIFAGCSKENDGDKEISINKDETKITNEDVNVTVSNSLKKSVDVPEDFPSDIIPIYNKGTVFGVSEQQGGYAIVILTKDDVKNVTDFYNNAFENANILVCNAEEDYYEITGSIDDYTFSITASEDTEKLGFLIII